MYYSYTIALSSLLHKEFQNSSLTVRVQKGGEVSEDQNVGFPYMRTGLAHDVLTSTLSTGRGRI